MKMFTKFQKTVLSLSLALLCLCGLLTSIFKEASRDEHIAMTLFGLVMFFVFFLCAKYPGTVWQMSDRQKMRYKTPQEGQDRYRNIMVTMDVGIALFMCVLMLLK